MRTQAAQCEAHGRPCTRGKHSADHWVNHAVLVQGGEAAHR